VSQSLLGGRILCRFRAVRLQSRAVGQACGLDQESIASPSAPFHPAFQGFLAFVGFVGSMAENHPDRALGREVGFEADFALNPGGSWIHAISVSRVGWHASGQFEVDFGGGMQYCLCWRPSTDRQSCGVCRAAIGHLVDS
jgi:hypothetical protein